MRLWTNTTRRKGLILKNSLIFVKHSRPIPAVLNNLRSCWPNWTNLTARRVSSSIKFSQGFFESTTWLLLFVMEGWSKNNSTSELRTIEFLYSIDGPKSDHDITIVHIYIPFLSSNLILNQNRPQLVQKLKKIQWNNNY